MTDKTKPHHVKMLDYEGSKLTRCKNKTGGKNNSDIDGFYEDKVSKRQYFVKKPVDQIELFAEAFAGAILQELIDRGIITEEEARSLIIAKVIKTDGGYALIQEKRVFRELFKIINTGNSKNSDRSPVIETLFGARKYKKLSDMQQSGLPIILMCAALLSAHSAHGGNTVFDDDRQLFARLDWGDAFRNLASPLNNKNILLSAESQGFLNVKWFTKNYIYKYRDVPGLFERVGQKGEAFKARLEQDDLNSIIAAALNRLPADLINAKQAKEFLAYAGMRSITIPLGKNANSDCEFVKEMATVLSVRLHKITGLAVKEPAPNSSAKQCDTEEYRRRLTKMVKINRYIKVIEKKAKDLDERGEIYAYDKANSLATNMKVLVEEFTTSGEDEQTALNQFKKEAKKYITEADKELGKHRRKWKHILANLGLAVMGLGVGYGVAALINHKVSGHYTFFDTTKSQKRTARLSHAVDDLEADDKTFIANRV